MYPVTFCRIVNSVIVRATMRYICSVFIYGMLYV